MFATPATLLMMEESRKRPRSPPPQHSAHHEAKRRATDQNTQRQPLLVKSPFSLTHIQDLPQEYNRNSVRIEDLLGDPLITECWNFNYMHDVDFILNAFDKDTRDLVQLHIVHGYWKSEDPSRQFLEAQASSHENITLHTAFMPQPFGTHHTKMIIIFRNDDTAQVIIHTANTIAKDWTNMTNGVWKSPLLPLQKEDIDDGDETESEDLDWEERQANNGPAKDKGNTDIGAEFKGDLFRYLRAYDSKRVICSPLVEKLDQFDFSAIRARLIGSVPGSHSTKDSRGWGWLALRNALKDIAVQEGASYIAAQMSSIATLGPQPTWLHDTLFKALRSSSKPSLTDRVQFSVIFPTADEIRRSLDGYASGASIHTRIQSAQQTKQLGYLRPIFCHWANDSGGGKPLAKDAHINNSGRNRAAPHIKTYIRFGEGSIDWALLTSANLSKQAWGEAINSEGKVRIASWELGVLVWPKLFGEDAVMVETFQTDTPAEAKDRRTTVGLRMPYSLPLQKYKSNETPWVATQTHTEPDHLGRTWTL